MRADTKRKIAQDSTDGFVANAGAVGTCQALSCVRCPLSGEV